MTLSVASKTIIVFISFSIVACSKKNDVTDSSVSDSLKKEVTIFTDTASLFQPLSKDILVYDAVGDSDVLVYKDKSAVFSSYSDSELDEIEKKNSLDDWEAIYDDYSYYGNQASLFLYKKTKTENASSKKYIRLVFATGEQITIDRFKSVGSIFFFNPQKGVKLCYTTAFDSTRYIDY